MSTNPADINRNHTIHHHRSQVHPVMLTPRAPLLWDVSPLPLHAAKAAVTITPVKINVHTRLFFILMPPLSLSQLLLYFKRMQTCRHMSWCEHHFFRLLTMTFRRGIRASRIKTGIPDPHESNFPDHLS